ncbi:hypothetical protein [Lachnospira eligens]|jgi:F0F1-type ATP synthase membrane subunit b/b'|uniref:hypothetical protein n=1 Tax=Lachnospira eligens TaxID=39485 RepID=UPI000E5CA315|nr:hypothetical protein [Lachnospira eligens]RGZ71297.1 hypothetical protein DW976_07685 [Lachnospira eligens]HBA11730.1 hypothetical protein [Eubacterium sp.]
MKGFENDRSWIIEKKNDIAIRAMDNKEKTDQFIEKRDTVEEGIARIPTDLPEDIQRQIDTAIQNVRNELKEERKELEDEANEIQESADDVLDKADMIGNDLKEKGNKLKDISLIPIIGSIADTKADEIFDQAEQISDLRQETQKYQDDLMHSRNRLFENR